MLFQKLISNLCTHKFEKIHLLLATKPSIKNTISEAFKFISCLQVEKMSLFIVFAYVTDENSLEMKVLLLMYKRRIRISLVCTQEDTAICKCRFTCVYSFVFAEIKVGNWESLPNTAERRTFLRMFEVYTHVRNSQCCHGRHPNWMCPPASSFCIELTENFRT